MRYTVALVKYAGGWREVEWAPGVEELGRRELLLELGSVEDVGQVDHLARSLLKVLSRTRETVTVGTFPTADAERPYHGYRNGDTITAAGSAQRVVGITVTEDDDGMPTYVPELQDPLTLEEERVQRTIKRMMDGSAGGLSEQTGPVRFPPIEVHTARVYELATFTFDGLLVNGSKSPPFAPPFPCAMTHVVLSFAVGGPEPVGLILYVDDVVVASRTVAAGTTRTTWDLPDTGVYVTDANAVTLQIFGDGGGAAGLVAQVKASPVG